MIDYMSVTVSEYLMHTVMHTGLWCIAYYYNLGNTSSSKCHNHGHHINSELELQELGDAIIDVASPHHCFHNAGEVVIGQDDI